MKLEMITNFGTGHQAHPTLRHIADHYHSMAWCDFIKQINKGTHSGVLIGSKYAKDFTRATQFFDPSVQSIVSHYSDEASKSIAFLYKAWYHFAPAEHLDMQEGEP